MNTVIGTISTVFIILMAIIGIPSTREFKDISEKISGDEIIQIPSNNVENEDIININELGMDSENIGGRPEDVDLISEYAFLKNIAEKNNLEIGRQMKIYIEEYEWQKAKDYSKFQENVVFYDFKDNKDPIIEMRFSENELLGECIPIFATNITTSTIQNQEVQLFERQIPEGEKNIIGKALFNINEMNFKIYVYDVSHQDFIEIVKTTIAEYKIFEEAKAEYIKLEDVSLYSEGTSLTELVKYDDKLYGRAYSEIDYGGNPSGPIGKIDKLIDSRYLPIKNGETNTERFLNAMVDSVTERRLILLAEEGAVPFERVYIKNEDTLGDFDRITKLTDEEVVSMYEKAQEIYLWFAETVPYEKLDYKNSIEDGVYLIKDERFSTLKELKDYLAEIFTVEITEKIEEKRFDTNLILEMDRKLYMSEYVTPKDIYCGEEKIKSIEYKENDTIIITVLAEVLGEDMLTVEKEEEHTFVLVYDNGKWKFSEFYCIGFYF